MSMRTPGKPALPEGKSGLGDILGEMSDVGDLERNISVESILR
jgi:hypothetical protein